MKTMFRLFMAGLLLGLVSPVIAQSVTYIHHADIMNQFLTMETGAGALQPAYYYNLFHKSYQKTANSRNKLAYRTEAMVLINQEKQPAESIDSSYVARAKVEALNIASRTQASDVTWVVEKSKINGKLDLFQKNINRIVASGGSSEDYEIWMNIYSCIETAIKYTRDSYLDMGQRKKEYLAIYQDLVKRNNQLVRKIQYWKGKKDAKAATDNTTKLQRLSSNKVIATDALRRWQSNFAVDGTSIR